MAGCINAYIRSDKAVVSYGYLSFVQHCEMEIGKEAFTHAYLLSVVAVERLIDDYIVISDVAKQTLEDVSIFSFSVMMSSFIDIIYQVFLVTDLEIDSFAIACQI